MRIVSEKGENRSGGADRLAVFLATSGHSGVDRIMTNLIPALAERGLDVDLLRIDRHGPHLSPIPDRVRRVPLGTAHVNSALPALCRYLREQRPDAILSDKDRVNRLVLLARWITGSSTRTVVRIGTTVSENLKNRGMLHRRMQLLSIRRLYPRADRIVVPSQGAAQDLARLMGRAGDRIAVLPSPVIREEIFDRAEDTPDHDWFRSREPECPIILGVGELSARKDFAILVQAFAKVLEVRPARLVILGEGRKRGSLLALARNLGFSDAVSLPGFADNPYAYMRRSHVFVLSSVCEGMPVVLLEALAMGTPVVSTDCPSGPREVLDNGRIGELVPMKDPEAMARAILRTLEHAPDPDRLKTAAAPYWVRQSAEQYAAALGFPVT